LTRFNTLSSGTLEGIASIGDTLLSLGGIETDIGGFVKETTTTSLSKPSLLSELINNSDNVLEKIISTTSDHIQFLLTNTSSIDLQNNNISQDKLTEKNIINSSNQLISEKQIETFKNNINSNSNNKEISIKELGNNTDLTRFNTLSTSLFNNKETLSTDNFIKLTEVPFDLIKKFLDSFQSNKASDLNNEIAVYTANKVANATAIPIVVPTPAPNVIVNSGNDNDQRTLLKPSIDPSSIRDIMRGFSYSMI
ncbi:MAG: hypothetical protein KC589_10320, partial [Nanoarchaeota archaeon]|nr:hypothetical protein [Nanoarchaeota archaeon]